MTRPASKEQKLQNFTSLGALISDMDHRLRAPIQTIMSLCGLLMETQLDSEQEEYVKELQASADRMVTLLSNLAELFDVRQYLQHADDGARADQASHDSAPDSQAGTQEPAGSLEEIGFAVAPSSGSQLHPDGEVERDTGDLGFLSNVSVLDEEEAFERIGRDSELLAELIEIFCDEAEERLSELTGNADDDDRIARIAHAMKGAAGNISANRLREIAIELERASKRGDQSRTWKLIETMRLETQVLREYLTKLNRTASR
jgi:HPt (histidine-containing phosphotransfer) domain-containing protein